MGHSGLKVPSVPGAILPRYLGTRRASERAGGGSYAAKLDSSLSTCEGQCRESAILILSRHLYISHLYHPSADESGEIKATGFNDQCDTVMSSCKQSPSV
ncbi:hypothetical protein LMH87_004493 [Akanthomyces muscarius]|uniref:Uncharacterized protein n=1 Tax=Akanthomyces muscarius TaxID=2231603 RepID=A0A9W8UH30_AKAMU|nr:hypothetical protein LMH87_004493 [Akanthomyces muscarius]KAJ4145651.1 hypothetical protein LMH87_004493 [Akanthomyces muscarius]